MEPSGLRKWRNSYHRVDIITGIAKKRLPWMTDAEFVKILHFYSRCSALFLEKGNIVERIARWGISLISSFRVKRGFFAFPFEYYIYCLAERRIQGI